MENHRKASQDDIAGEVNRKFLDTLAAKNVPQPVIERLQKLLQAEKKPSRKALSDALFAENPPP